MCNSFFRSSKRTWFHTWWNIIDLTLFLIGIHFLFGALLSQTRKGTHFHRKTLVMEDCRGVFLKFWQRSFRKEVTFPENKSKWQDIRSYLKVHSVLLRSIIWCIMRENPLLLSLAASHQSVQKRKWFMCHAGTCRCINGQAKFCDKNFGHIISGPDNSLAVPIKRDKFVDPHTIWQNHKCCFGSGKATFSLVVSVYSHDFFFGTVVVRATLPQSFVLP